MSQNEPARAGILVLHGVRLTDQGGPRGAAACSRVGPVTLQRPGDATDHARNHAYLVVQTRPASLQKKGSKKRYKEELRKAASARWASSPMLEGRLFARVAWFHAADADGDIDNMIKPILDALEGVVYAKDRVVAVVQAARYDLRDDVAIRLDQIPGDIAEQLTRSLTGPHTLYVEIGVMDAMVFTTGVVR